MKIYKSSGFTLVEIMIVVAIIGILAAIAVPNFQKNIRNANRASCIRSMQQLANALESYRTSNDMEIPVSFDTVIGPENYLQTMPRCPSGGSYSFTPDPKEENQPILVFCSYGNGHVYRGKLANKQ